MSIPILLSYAVLIYIVWWIISRLGLFGAWLYRKPQTTKFKHYLFFLVATIPFAMEIISSMLIMFGIAFSFELDTLNSENN